MRKFSQMMGTLAIVLWTLGGTLAWVLVGEGLEVTIQEKASKAEAAPQAFLLDRIKVLENDLRSLTQSLETNFGLLNESLLANTSKVALDQAAELARIRADLANLAIGQAELERIASAELAEPMAPMAGHNESTPVVLVPVTEPEPIIATPSAATPPAIASTAPKKSFLSFALPSDDFSFDEKRSWTLLPALSRVGFDGSSTLHDFSALTSDLKGEFKVNLAHPQQGLSGLIQVRASVLNSGLADRDSAMREHLLVEKYEYIEFQLQRFVPATNDPKAKRLSGQIEGNMMIRGVSRPMSMDVKLNIDDSGRLIISGQAPLRLTDFEIPVPNKLGLVKMENEIEIWISLSARCVPRSN